MNIPIKQIITEGINSFIDNAANGVTPSYTAAARAKDKNILTKVAPVGAAIGGIVGATVDGLHDGNTYDANGHIIEPEPTGNGLIAGAALGALGSTAYGVNRNHNFINKQNISGAYNTTKNVAGKGLDATKSGYNYVKGKSSNFINKFKNTKIPFAKNIK